MSPCGPADGEPGAFRRRPVALRQARCRTRATVMALRHAALTLTLAIAAVLGHSAGRTVEAMEPVMTILKAADGWGPNLLRNPGFEETEGRTAQAWQPYEERYDLAAGAGRDGETAIFCRNETAGRRRGASQTVELNQATPVPLRVSGWSRAAGVSGGGSSDYSVYVDLTYQDGTPLWAQTANFSGGTHDWERREVLIVPARPVKSLTVYALFRELTGEVWFDDFELCQLGAGQGALLDMVPVEVRQLPAGAAEGLALAEAVTGDGLALGYDWQTGRVSSLKLDGAELAVPAVPSGFLARDVAADSDVYAFENGDCAPLGLKLEARLEGSDKCIWVSGQIANLNPGDRAVTLFFALPVGAQGWEWHDDIRSHRGVGPLEECANLTNIQTGANGHLSIYPLGCITGLQGGLALAVDMDLPAQYRIACNGSTGQLYIAYDFGLCADTERFPNAAPFRFVIYRFDAAWGFRAGVRKLYDVFPDHFLCRSRVQGIWMPFTDVSTVQGWQDFGFRYHEGNDNVPFDDSAEILSFRYTEPSTWWFPLDPAVPRTYENVMKALQEAATSSDAWRRRGARATLVSASHDEQGHVQYLVRDAPWTNGVVFSRNPSPYIPGDSEARLHWNDAVKQQLYGPAAAGTQDGEYLDSLEGYVTADENFRREQFRYMTVPLTFSRASGRPVIHKAFSQYEFTKWIAADVHGMGKLTFANGVPEQFSFLCPWLDIMGWETDWLTGDGRWQPASDRTMNLKRTMSYRKPYLSLMNTDFDRLTPDLVEKYFQRSLFYGMWPSMFSHNAYDAPYWRNPKWYNRDRHLFKRYIPLVRLVAEAGWEPVTHAVTDKQDVYVERFGPSERGSVYFTLMNDSAEHRVAVLTIDAAELGLKEAGRAEDLVSGELLSVAALVSGELLSVAAQDGRLRVVLMMRPEQVRRVAFSRAGDARPAAPAAAP